MLLRCLVFVFQSSNLPILKFSVLLTGTFVIFSCGNSNTNNNLQVTNDSLSANLAAINAEIDQNRNNPESYFKRAKYFFSKNEFENAINDLQIVLKIDSSQARYWIFLSDLYFTQNKTRHTRHCLLKAIALDSSNTEALLKYSQLFYILKKYDTAVYYINRCLNFDKLNSVAYFQKGMILKEARDTANALESFQQAVEINPQYFDAYMQLGILHAARHQNLALEYFSAALALRPRSTEALYAKAKFLQDTQQYENALAAYDTLLSVSPENIDAIFNKGAVFFEMKLYEKAKQQFERTILRDLNYFRGYYGRGRCYEAAGKKQLAIADYQRCLALNPGFELATLQLDALQAQK